MTRWPTLMGAYCLTVPPASGSGPSEAGTSSCTGRSSFRGWNDGKRRLPSVLQSHFAEAARSEDPVQVLVQLRR
jgi:hypothetical protein